MSNGSGVCRIISREFSSRNERPVAAVRGQRVPSSVDLCPRRREAKSGKISTLSHNLAGVRSDKNHSEFEPCDPVDRRGSSKYFAVDGRLNAGGMAEVPALCSLLPMSEEGTVYDSTCGQPLDGITTCGIKTDPI